MTPVGSVPPKARGFRVRQAIDLLRDLLIQGKLAPGMRLVESDLEDRLGISRTPVRTALHRLFAEGYVTGSGHGKEFFRVSSLSADDGAELFEMIGKLESLAARRAATLPDPARAVLANRLAARNRELAKAVRSARRDAATASAVDERFHRAFIDVGAGPRLLRHLEVLKPQAERYSRLHASAYLDHRETSLEEHDRVIDAIRAGQPGAAMAAVERHWRNAATRLISALRANQPESSRA